MTESEQDKARSTKEKFLGIGFVLGFGFSLALLSVASPGTQITGEIEVENTSLIDAAANADLVEEFCQDKGYGNGYQTAGPGSGRLQVFCFTDTEEYTHKETYRVEAFGTWVNAENSEEVSE
jgi:hypothetical protein